MSLANIYLELLRRARETGEDRAQTLGGGARLAVRVMGDVVTLTISREKRRVGDTELITFKRDCNVPENAIRFPQEGQRPVEREGQMWHAITWRWREEAP